MILLLFSIIWKLSMLLHVYYSLCIINKLTIQSHLDYKNNNNSNERLIILRKNSIEIFYFDLPINMKKNVIIR